MASVNSNMKTTTCLLTEDELKDLCRRYDLFPEYEVLLPTPDQTALDAPPGKINLYTHDMHQITCVFLIKYSLIMIAFLKYYCKNMPKRFI
jgi:hypothetical protein